MCRCTRLHGFHEQPVDQQPGPPGAMSAHPATGLSAVAADQALPTMSILSAHWSLYINMLLVQARHLHTSSSHPPTHQQQQHGLPGGGARDERRRHLLGEAAEERAPMLIIRSNRGSLPRFGEECSQGRRPSVLRGGAHSTTTGACCSRVRPRDSMRSLRLTAGEGHAAAKRAAAAQPGCAQRRAGAAHGLHGEMDDWMAHKRWWMQCAAREAGPS